MTTTKPSTDCDMTTGLLKHHEVPEYAREFSITTGYRKKLSYKGCISSWFWLHNESVNIWTHLFGFLIFFYYFAMTVFSPKVSSYSDLAPIIIQLLTYQICMLSSTLFHTFSCHSEVAHKSWLETDHFGILMALFGTYVSVIYDKFACHPTWRSIHMGAVLSIFIPIIILKHVPNFRSTGKSTSNIMLQLFMLLGLYAILPLLHWAYLAGGIENTYVKYKLSQAAIPYLIAGIGLVFYKSRFPERIFRPGSVDIFGASHQVWHLMIFLGMAYWYKDTLDSYSRIWNYGCEFTSEDAAVNSTGQVQNYTCATCA